MESYFPTLQREWERLCAEQIRRFDYEVDEIDLCATMEHIAKRDNYDPMFVEFFKGLAEEFAQHFDPSDYIDEFAKKHSEEIKDYIFS